MTESAAALTKLLVQAEIADPADRIALRDPIAAHGAAAIEAVSPWLKVPNLAAFAIRVIARVGLDGEREAAMAALRQARRRVDARLRVDVDWAIGVLKAPALEPPPAPAKPAPRARAATPPRGTRPRPRASSAS